MKPRDSRPEHRREWSRFGPMQFALWLPIGFLAFLGLGALMKQLPPAVPLAYATCSLVTVGLYAHDKSKAQRDVWRISESTLHILDVMGGWPGGLLAQRVFRHKTRKLWFQVVFWLCVAVHILTWGWIFVSVPAETEFSKFARQFARVLQMTLSR